MTLTVGTRGTRHASTQVLLLGQVVEGSWGAGIGVLIRGVHRAVVPCRTHIQHVVRGVGRTEVSLRTVLTAPLIGQVLVGAGRAGNGEVRALRAVVASGTDVADDGVDAAGGTLGVVQHYWVGFVHPRHAVVSLITLTRGRCQVVTCKFTRSIVSSSKKQNKNEHTLVISV